MYKLLTLNLARNALRYIIKEYNIKVIHIPYYLCPVIRQSIMEENCKALFYHIDDEFFPVKNFDKNDYILYPNYFGVCDKNVDKLAATYKNLIIDNAHSFFSKPKGLAAFNSARKFLPVFWGSNLWIKKSTLEFPLDTTKYTIPTNEKEKVITENNFAFFDIKQIEFQTDFSESIITKRKKIFIELHNKYNSTNLLKFNSEECFSPFCYPYLVQDKQLADELVNTLAKKNVDIVRYWNSIPSDFSEYKFYERLVSIPITINKYSDN